MFKKIVFPQNVDLAYNVKFWQLCWSFLSNLKSKQLKIRSYWVRSIIFKKFVFHQLFLGTDKMHLCQICCKIFAENTEKFRFKTEVCEKNFFSKEMFFMKTLLWTSNCSSENRSQKLRVKSLYMVCSKFNNETKTFLIERHILIQNISLETKISILSKLLKIATEGPGRSTLKSKKC